MQNGRHRVFNFAMNLLDAHTLSQKLDTKYKKLKCAAKLNVAFSFVLENVEDGTSLYYYAHENNTLMQRSKFVSTKENLVKIKNVLSNTDVFGAFTKNEQIQSGNSKNPKVSLFWLLYSEKFPWGVKTQYCHRHLQKTTLLIVQLTMKIQENRTMTIYVSLELSLCICMEMGDLRNKLQKCSHYSSRKLEELIHQVFKVFVG